MRADRPATGEGSTDPSPARRERRSRVTTAALVLAALVTLASCTSPGTPGADDPGDSGATSTASPSDSAGTETGTTEPIEPTGTGSGATPDVSVADVRATLGAVDPCALLGDAGDGARARLAEGPHTCEAQLGGARVRVEVGVPLDDTGTEAARSEVAGLVALTALGGCRVVFPVGPEHGVSVTLDDRCDVLPRAADVVGTTLGAPDADDLLRPSGPDAHTACELISAVVDEPDLLVDAAGPLSQGLDHCALEAGPVLARTGLDIDYTPLPFDRLAQLLRGARVTVAGRDAVVSESGTGCFVHTYLWESRARGHRDEVSAEAVVRARDCREARRVTGELIAAAAVAPVAPGSLTDLVAASQG